MTVISIPASVDEACASLDGVGRLLTAKRWERAAIVYALVGPAPGHGPGRGVKEPGNGFFSLQGLAQRGITGLTKEDTIARYRDAWQFAIDEGHAEVVALGDEIDIPDDWEWPPNMEVGNRDTTMTPQRRETLMDAGRQAGMPSGSKVVDIAANPRSMQAAIKADPATLRAAEEAVEEARMERHNRLVREAGGNPDLPPEPFPGELGLRARSINGRLQTLTADLRRLHERCEPDQWEAVQALLDPTITRLSAAVFGGVPDTIEGLTQ